MWRGFEPALEQYLREMILEWKSRGYKNTMEIPEEKSQILYPPWFKDEKFHAAHRSNLLRKKPLYYFQFGWKENSDLPYIWPAD
jgi:CDP-glycerol glycerophosphotransferase (TagB/SpsB family)